MHCIFSIDNPIFAEHIPDIYPRELQLNKANTSKTETSFYDWNIKVIGNNIHTSVYDNHDDLGFPIVNFPWLSGDVLRLQSCGMYISQLVRFARCCTSVFNFHSKTLPITPKLLTQGYRYHKLRKTFGKFFRSYSELLSKFGEYSFKNMNLKESLTWFFTVILSTKLRRVKERRSKFHLVGLENSQTPSTSSVWQSDNREDYMSCTALYRFFIKRCTLTNNAVETILRALSKPLRSWS